MHLVSEPIQSPLTLELEISHTPSLDIDVLTTGELGNTSVKTIQEEYDADIRIIHQNVNEGMDMNEIDELLHHASVTRDGKLMTMEMTLMIAQERSKTMVSIYYIQDWVLTYSDKKVPPPSILLSLHNNTNLNSHFKYDKFSSFFFKSIYSL